jgi:hypothetical protein
MTEEEADRYFSLDIIERWKKEAEYEPHAWKARLQTAYARIITEHPYTHQQEQFRTFLTVCASALTEDERVAALVKWKMGLYEWR